MSEKVKLYSSIANLRFLSVEAKAQDPTRNVMDGLYLVLVIFLCSLLFCTSLLIFQRLLSQEFWMTSS